MESSLSSFRPHFGALNVLLGALFSFPVDLSLSLCFSGHVICSLAILLFLLLTPLQTLTSCRPHVDLWPTSLPFFLIFATSRAYSFFFFFFFCSWKPYLFFLVSALWHTPLTQTVYSAPTGMGKVTPRSLFLCLWPSPSSICLVSPPSCLRACACAGLSAHPQPPVCVVHGATGMRCRTRVRLAEQDSDARSLVKPHGWQTRVYLCMACKVNDTTVSVPPRRLHVTWGGSKKGPDPFLVKFDLSLLCSCMNVVVVL